MNNGMGMRKSFGGGYGNRDHQSSDRGSYNSGAGMKRQWESSGESHVPAKRPYQSYEQGQQKVASAPAPLFATTPSYASSASYASPPPPPTYAQSSVYSNFPALQMQPQAYIQYPSTMATAAPPNLQNFLSYPPPPIAPK